MKQLLILLFLLCSIGVSAQDVIVKKDGTTILSKVLEVGQSEIMYKKHENLDGPTYTISKSELQAINYQNGAKDTFSEPVREDNRYLPNNQNDGEQQYNDRALLSMDFANQKSEKKAKNLQTWGWISGIGGLGVGALLINLGKNADDEGLQYYIPGGICILGGIASSSYCFITAHKLHKQMDNLLQSSILYHHDFKINNGTSLSAGIDMISNHILGTNTVGLGLRYQF